MLQDQSSILTNAIKDGALHPASGYEGLAIQELAEAGLVTSFNMFLPMSDSVFVTSSDPNLFIRQLSHLLVSQFVFRLHSFANPELDADPRLVTMKSIELTGSAVQMSEHRIRWWPILYRGGVAFGDVYSLKMPAISDLGKTLPNLTGMAVVEAVRLEKLVGKGPRLACSEAFAKQITGDSAAFIATNPTIGPPSQYEILWPMAMFADSQGPADGLANHLLEWLTGAINLWCHFANCPVGVHYLELITLTIRAFHAKWPEETKAWPNLHSLPAQLAGLQPSKAEALTVLGSALKGGL